MRIQGTTSGPWLALAIVIWAATARGQGPAPETAPPLFPGGALISYNSIFTTRDTAAGVIGNTTRPTFSHQGAFNFTWGFHPDWDLALVVPIVTNRYTLPGTPGVGGTSLGDATILLKYRFLRRDSPRGTTQASVTFGPKLPTGRTGFTDANGARLYDDTALAGAAAEGRTTLIVRL